MARTDLFRKLRFWLKMAQQEGSGPWAYESEPNLTRRQILSRSAQVLALSSLPACVTRMAAASLEPTGEFYDRPLEIAPGLVIVGGGLAGLTAAYELTKAGINVSVYEASERFGGRVFTSYSFNDDDMFCEKGAEFVDTNHEELIALAAELGVEMQALHSKSKSLADEVYFFGGRMRTEKELISGFAPLAKILQKDMKKLMVKGELQVPTYKQTLGPDAEALDRISLSEYLERCRSSVNAWILDLIRVAYVGEYGLEADEQSALNLLILIDPETKGGLKIFGESDEAFRIHGGSSQLVQALVRKLEGLQVPVYLQHELTAVKQQGSGLKLVFTNDTRTVEVLSATTILALPLPILRKIEGLLQLDLSPVKKQVISEMGFGSNSKFMVGFKQRYWQKGVKGSKGHKGSIFTDQESQAYWDSSRLQEGEAGILTNFLGGKAGVLIGPGKLSQVLSDLDKMMPGIQALHDGHKVLQHWPSAPTALGSYICPKPGQYTSLIGAAEEPELNETLYFIGEHCSVDYGGYMNGAVSSGKALVKNLLQKVGTKTKEAS